MDKISTMTELENIFQEAKKKDAKYVMVKIAMQGFEKPEVIVNPKENIDSKLAYYKKAYKEDLHLKTFDGIQIVEAGYISDMKEERYTVGSVRDLKDVPKKKFGIYNIAGTDKIYVYNGDKFSGINNGDVYLVNNLDEVKSIEDSIAIGDVVLVIQSDQIIIKDEEGKIVFV